MHTVCLEPARGGKPAEEAGMLPPTIMQYRWQGMSIDEKLEEITRRQETWKTTGSGLSG